MPWTPEEAAAYAKKGGEARAAQAKLRREHTPEERAKAAISGKMEEVTKELLQAALGSGDFENLSAKDRLPAILRVLEYGLGKPSAMAPRDDTDPDKPEAGIHFE